MSYCIAVSVDEGLVLTSDSRTNAGIDNVSTYGKMHIFATQDDRKLVLLSAGNLATTQAVVEQLRRDKRENASINLNSVSYLSEAADYLGRISIDKQKWHAEALDSPVSNRAQPSSCRPNWRRAARRLSDLSGRQQYYHVPANAISADRRKQIRQASARPFCNDVDAAR